MKWGMSFQECHYYESHRKRTFQDRTWEWGTRTNHPMYDSVGESLL